MDPCVGDIFQVPLPDGRFAYGKVFRDASVGIYDTVFDSPVKLPIKSPFAFFVGLYKYILEDGIWPIVGHEPFASTDEEWPPPYFIRDVISGDFSLYHKGVIRPSLETECRGLEEAAAWDADDVIDRIVRTNEYLQ
jgi:hypothetical protein